jgi:hypothetical protein
MAIIKEKARQKIVDEAESVVKILSKKPLSFMDIQIILMTVHDYFLYDDLAGFIKEHEKNEA